MLLFKTQGCKYKHMFCTCMCKMTSPESSESSTYTVKLRWAEIAGILVVEPPVPHLSFMCGRDCDVHFLSWPVCCSSLSFCRRESGTPDGKGFHELDLCRQVQWSSFTERKTQNVKLPEELFSTEKSGVNCS